MCVARFLDGGAERFGQHESQSIGFLSELHRDLPWGLSEVKGRGERNRFNSVWVPPKALSCPRSGCLWKAALESYRKVLIMRAGLREETLNSGPDEAGSRPKRSRTRPGRRQSGGPRADPTAWAEHIKRNFPVHEQQQAISGPKNAPSPPKPAPPPHVTITQLARDKRDHPHKNTDSDIRRNPPKNQRKSAKTPPRTQMTACT